MKWYAVKNIQVVAKDMNPPNTPEIGPIEQKNIGPSSSGASRRRARQLSARYSSSEKSDQGGYAKLYEKSQTEGPEIRIR